MNIGGVINEYSAVGAIDAGDKRILTVSNPLVFHQSDTVLLIQMTGVNETTGSSVGAGKYEIHIIESIAGDAITLRIPVSEVFEPVEKLQLVRMHSYKNATVTSPLTCKPWDYTEGTGGVLAFLVENTLTLNVDIDVSGKGFRGGQSDDKPGMSFPAKMPHDPYYAEILSDSAGRKGEGNIRASAYDITRRRGIATALSDMTLSNLYTSGGGGGNGAFNGGGGGGNCGNGGRGVLSSHYTDEEDSKYRAFGGGSNIIEPTLIFMGGGGGTGVGMATNGGNGGGIVIIAATTIVANNGAKISANGATVTGAVTDGGAGGGGAGGSVFIAAENFGAFTIELNGGDGGNVASPNAGPGGGGDGGMIFVNKDNIPETLNLSRKGGEGGSENGERQASSGKPYLMDGLSQILQTRGFIRNVIIPPAHSMVCSGDSIIITAYQPEGGYNDLYTFKWQRRLSSSETWVDAGSSRRDLRSGALPAGVYYFRRHVETTQLVGGYEYPISENSDSTKVEVLPPIADNILLLNDTSICGSAAVTINGQKAMCISSSGEMPLAYSWEQQIDNGAWTTITNTSQSLRAPMNDSEVPTTFRFRRTVDVALDYLSCSNISNTKSISIVPSIKNNSLAAPQRLCETETPAALQLDAVAGGDGSYTYKWLSSTDCTHWTLLADATAEYQPETFNGSNDSTYFRRVVVSDICVDTSDFTVVGYDRLPSAADILTFGDTDSVYFKFNLALEAAPITYGHGKWTSPDDITFTRPDDADTEARGLVIGDNHFVWTVSNGRCPADSDALTLTVLDVVIPDGFSPNDDGINDCFGVRGAENVESLELTIVNRYNTMVFHTSTLSAGSYPYACLWDGSDDSGKKLPSGTYFYQLTLNKDKIYKGYVILRK